NLPNGLARTDRWRVPGREILRTAQISLADQRASRPQPRGSRTPAGTAATHQQPIPNWLIGTSASHIIDIAGRNAATCLAWPILGPDRLLDSPVAVPGLPAFIMNPRGAT